MKRKNLYLMRSVTYALFLIIPIITNAQSTLPKFASDTWDSFINSAENSIVRDTFFLQTFNKLPTDTWEYTYTQNVSLFDPLTEGFTDASEGLALKIPVGSSVSFAEIDKSEYSLYIKGATHLSYAISKVMPGETLHIYAERQNSPFDKECLIPTQEYSCSFKKAKEIATPKDRQIAFFGLSFSLQINTGITEKETKGGFYAIDSVFSFGEIQQYSLFTGKGRWESQHNWSHHPPYRSRKALINGTVSIANPIKCNELLLGEGEIQVKSGGMLQVDKLSLNADNSSFLSFGEVKVNETATVWKKFPTKGKWYFISFPFDVYMNGIDPLFQWKDENFTGSGNYFYVQKYDGDRRAFYNQSSGNWKVSSPAEAINKGGIIFEKGKGYLIALDEKATTQEIFFTSRPGVIDSDFGKQGTLPIQQPTFTDKTQQEHKGWILCGNPLPSPLPISSISKEVLQDQYIYIATEEGYEAYTIDSDYAIPPYSAFFIQAKKNQDLLIEAIGIHETMQLLSTSPVNTEPQAKQSSTANEVITEIEIQVGKEGIYINNLFSPGQATVIDISGHIIQRQTISPQQTLIPLQLNRGIYILILRTEGHTSHHKFVWED